MSPWYPWPVTTWPVVGLAWDDGITHWTKRTAGPTAPVLSIEYVRDQVLRVANGTVEDAYVEQAIHAATDAAEKQTNLVFPPQTFAMYLSGFPWGGIELSRKPFIEMVSLAYTDADGDAQEMAVSPLGFQVVPSGDYAPAVLLPLYGESWPSVRTQAGAVVVTFRAGFEEPSLLPANEVAGIGIYAGELYKQRSLSVQQVHNTPAVLNLDLFWPRRY